MKIDELCKYIFDQGTNTWGGVLEEGEEMKLSAHIKKEIDPQVKQIRVTVEIGHGKLNAALSSKYIVYPHTMSLIDVRADLTDLIGYVYHGVEKVARQINLETPGPNEN